MQQGIEIAKNNKTYPQNWRAYNAAQTTEKKHFLDLLDALCRNLEEPAQTNGRPRLPIHDAIFTVCFKIYSGFSGRRFMTDLQDAKDAGYIGKAPHFNTIYNILDDADLTPILHSLIETTSLPLAAVETDFAADSSGFTASRVARWQDHKYGGRKQHEWCKVHLMCGVKTNIVTAVEIGDKNAHDSPFLPALIEATAKNFRMDEVLADKAYGSFKNYDAIAAQGATPYIPFKESRKGAPILSHLQSDLWGYKTRDEKKTKNPLWNKMYHLFRFHEEEFAEHYHKRSNVEATFSMIKAKFGGFVRSKTEQAMANECLCKVICHNICVLIQETHELGIDVDFGR